ncbi:unknown protein [Seminavis robusta]|uniref:Uncharacterized protein n=1 Tax=Seminavis robusta TaxID=568900 RepID=A0A9N8HM22_9STRA|nr:unknown protein [Seminavis robusta]|eukprot:Sro963_g225320.1 n/a (195) ;mRNA; f:21515-22226
MTSRASKKRAKTDEAVQTAGMLLKLSKKGGGMTAHSALRLAGVSTDDRANRNLQRRALRARDKFDEQRKQLESDFSQIELEEEEDETQDHPFPDSQESVIPIVPTLPKQLKMRKTSKQAAAQRKANIQVKDLKAKLFQEAVESLQQQSKRQEEAIASGCAYRKKSAETICNEINATALAQAHGIKIVARTMASK